MSIGTNTNFSEVTDLCIFKDGDGYYIKAEGRHGYISLFVSGSEDKPVKLLLDMRDPEDRK